MASILRSPEEMKAYVEGYNACNKHYKEHLMNGEGKRIADIIQEMEVLVSAVNGVLNNEQADTSRWKSQIDTSRWKAKEDNNEG